MIYMLTYKCLHLNFFIFSQHKSAFYFEDMRILPDISFAEKKVVNIWSKIIWIFTVGIFLLVYLVEVQIIRESMVWISFVGNKSLCYLTLRSYNLSTLQLLMRLRKLITKFYTCVFTLNSV